MVCEDIRVVEQAVPLETLEQPVDELVDRLQRPQALPIEVIVEFDIFLAQALSLPDPVRPRWLLGVEVWCPGYFRVREEVFVALEPGSEARISLPGYRRGSRGISSGMLTLECGATGAMPRKEGFAALNRIVKEAIRFLSQDVQLSARPCSLRGRSRLR